MRDPTDDHNNNDADIFDESPKIDNPSDDFMDPILTMLLVFFLT